MPTTETTQMAKMEKKVIYQELVKTWSQVSAIHCRGSAYRCGNLRKPFGCLHILWPHTSNPRCTSTKKCAPWHTERYLQCYSMATNGNNSNVQQLFFYFEKLEYTHIMECYATLKNNRLLFYSTADKSHRYVIG